MLYYHLQDWRASLQIPWWRRCNFSRIIMYNGLDPRYPHPSTAKPRSISIFCTVCILQSQEFHISQSLGRNIVQAVISPAMFAQPPVTDLWPLVSVLKVWDFKGWERLQCSVFTSYYTPPRGPKSRSVADRQLAGCISIFGKVVSFLYVKMSGVTSCLYAN